MIYFIQAGADGPVKIGKADNVASRASALATAHYAPLVVLAALDAPSEAERHFHWHLHKHRRRGEWFDWCLEVHGAVEMAKRGEWPREAQPPAMPLVKPLPGKLMHLAQSVRQQAQAAPVSTRRLAAMAGIDESTLRTFMAGSDTRVSTLDALITALGSLEQAAAA